MVFVRVLDSALVLVIAIVVAGDGGHGDATHNFLGFGEGPMQMRAFSSSSFLLFVFGRVGERFSFCRVNRIVILWLSL